MKINLILTLAISYFLIGHIMDSNVDWMIWLNGAAFGVLLAYWSNYLRRKFDHE